MLKKNQHPESTRNGGGSWTPRWSIVFFFFVLNMLKKSTSENQHAMEMGGGQKESGGRRGSNRSGGGGVKGEGVGGGKCLVLVANIFGYFLFPAAFTSTVISGRLLNAACVWIFLVVEGT